MEPIAVDDVAEFSSERYQKVSLVESANLFVDVYCFHPGQSQDPHDHAASDKVYYVIEGTGTATIGEEEHSLDVGDLVHAPAGVRHGFRNDGDQPLRVLVWMAPPPTAGGHHHEHVETQSRTIAVFTVSTTRSLEDDEGGRLINDRFVEAGHTVATYDVIPDDADAIQLAVEAVVDDVDAVVLTGGTGVTPDDVTIEAVTSLFDKELPGFGEYFRHLSVADIGSAVIMTRATAGIVGDVPIFAIPGSTAAVDLAIADIILPELDHLVDLAGR